MTRGIRIGYTGGMGKHPRIGSGARRDLARNAAFFLGALGMTLGLLGLPLAALGIWATLVPEAAATAPDWIFAAVVILLIVAVVGAWPAVDWLVNRRPLVGAWVMAGTAALMAGIGAASIGWTAWGIAGWAALTGGLLLMLAAWLAALGGGTTPLVWSTLRTPRVRAVEGRLDAALGVLGAIAAVIGGAAEVAVGAAVVAVAAIGWWLATQP